MQLEVVHLDGLPQAQRPAHRVRARLHDVALPRLHALHAIAALFLGREAGRVGQCQQAAEISLSAGDGNQPHADRGGGYVAAGLEPVARHRLAQALRPRRGGFRTHLMHE
ncbi:MAG TPA: hypothetical protein PLI44_08460, partial [Chiayiivirga sp.]|nr:hypothetical protein [Chiayiivirga sp.]